MAARRIIKSSPDAQAGLEVGEQAVRLLGSRETGLYMDPSGVYVIGNISLLAQPENIRVAGSYTFPSANKARLPSTAVNPQPILVDNSPVEGFSDLASQVAELLGRLV